MGLPAEAQALYLISFSKDRSLYLQRLGAKYCLLPCPFKFDNEDYLTFKIKVTPKAEGAKPMQAYDFKFQKDVSQLV